MAVVITNRTVGQQQGQRAYWIYNGLDCCITREVWDVLHPRLSKNTRHIYKFQMGLQAPAMAMMFRGVKVAEHERDGAIKILETDLVALTAAIQEIVRGHGWDMEELNSGRCPAAPEKPHNWPRGVEDTKEKTCKRCGASRLKPADFNANSDDDAKYLFYEKIGLPEMYNKRGVVSVDKDVLDRIENRYDELKPLVKAIKAIRGNRKQTSVLRTGVSNDGRMRSTFVIGGAETGRQSSTANPYDEGTNLQNIAEKLRHIFVADTNRLMFYADLEQAESNAVAHLAGCEAYIDAHKGGDVHTHVCRLVWPELPWTGDLKKDKELADGTNPPWDPDHSYRLNCKRLQHGSNYLLTPRGMAIIAHIPVAAARDGQERYFTEFPEIREWHRKTYREIKETGMMVTPLGRQRQFFGRIWDDHTVKQGIAHGPQSMVADILNTAMWHVWHELEPDDVWLYAQIHDALLGSVPAKRADKILGRLLELMTIPVKIVGADGIERTMAIGTDVKVGKNWGKFNDNPKKGRLNPDGMK